jgi:hypothetical protein
MAGYKNAQSRLYIPSTATESMETKKHLVLLAAGEAINFEREKRMCYKPLRVWLL